MGKIGTPRRKPGRMGPFVEDFRDSLVAAGYAPGSVRHLLKDVGALGRWMEVADVTAGELNPRAIEQFREDRIRSGRRRVAGARSFVPLLEHLRAQRVLVEEPAVLTPVGQLVQDYRTWLVDDRGLAAPTVLRYEKTARLFLLEQLGEPDVEAALAGLTGASVVAFLLRECGRVSVGAAKGRVAELRSLLRFLYLTGRTASPLGAAVPPVAGWHDTGLPATLTASDVQRLLDSCDRAGPVGARDYAILMLVARLGLRSAEVARLELGDIDWRSGQVAVRGKGRRSDHLPLPHDVGEAIAAHLAATRPVSAPRNVFLAFKAPIRAIPPALVSDRPGCSPGRSGPGLREGAQPAQVHLGVDRGGGQVAVSQHLADLRQRGPSRQQLGGQRVSQPMGSDPGQPGPVAGAVGDVDQYLALRRSLGHELAEVHRLLPGFVAYLDQAGAPRVTLTAAMAWATQPQVGPDSTVWSSRLSLARGFARYMSGFDPDTEVPPRVWFPPGRGGGPRTSTAPRTSAR